MSRRIAALLLLTAFLLGACDQAKSFGDKASACAEALGLGTLVPDTDPEKTKQEALAKAERLRQLAKDTQDGKVKNALTTLADEYVEVSKRELDQLRNTVAWAGRLATTQENLRKICL